MLGISSSFGCGMDRLFKYQLVYYLNKKYLFITNSPLLVLVWAFTSFSLINVSLAKGAQDSLLSDLAFVPKSSLNLCQGYYQEPLLQPIARDHTIISAAETILQPKGISVLRKGVTIESGLQKIYAEEAHVHTDSKTGKVTHIDLIGHVRYLAAGRLLLGQRAHINLADHTGTIEDALYRLVLDENFRVLEHEKHYLGPMGWGKALVIKKTGKDYYILHTATYTSCPPTLNQWSLKSKELHVDKEEGKATSYKTTFYIGKLPIFYTPYLTFPTDQRRRTGFLSPTYSLSDRLGLDIGLPFYWNMKPNYDMTFTTRLLTKRGVMFTNEFRYLLPESNGQFKVSFLPSDRQFPKQITRQKLLGQQRGALDFQHHAHLFSNWHLDIDYHGVTDDDYIQDFVIGLGGQQIYQLKQQIDLSYQNKFLYFLSRAQAFQTLQPSNQAPTGFAYQRLPQITLNLYPDTSLPVTFKLQNEFNHFIWPSDRNVVPWTVINRMYTEPIIQYSYSKPYLFFRPSFSSHSTFYDLKGLNGTTMVSRRSIGRVTPIVSIDSGLILDRHKPFQLEDWRQTLEPRVFYAFIPYRNQSQLPLIDSNYQLFTFDQLFRANRFLGHDRIGDTHHMSFALSSRFIDDRVNQDIIKMGIGQAVYFSKRRVGLGIPNFASHFKLSLIKQNLLHNPNALESDYEQFYIGYTSQTSTLSPTVAFIQLKPRTYFQIDGDVSYETYDKRPNHARINVTYAPLRKGTYHLGYTFTRNGEALIPSSLPTVKTYHLSQIHTSGHIPITEKWSTYAGISYNISAQYFRTFFIGLEYNSCCWATRILASRTFTGLDENYKPQFGKMIYFQILLKGLGSYQSNDLQTFLSNQIPRFNDHFITGKTL